MLPRLQDIKPHLLLFAMIACIAAGCGGSDVESVELLTVTGKVSYEGTAIPEGTIQFEDASTGISSSSEIGRDGSYSLQVSKGNYKVTILPPVVEVETGPDSPPAEELKQMPNIPENYRQSASSDLSATVNADGENHDFDMKS